MPSGENHSSESHTCGRTLSPRRSRSEYSCRTCAASGERLIESFRSQKRFLSSSSSLRRAHEGTHSRATRRRGFERTARERPAARVGGIRLGGGIFWEGAGEGRVI